MSLRESEIHTVVVGTGAAGYHAAVRLHQYGEHDLAIISENVEAGTSRNTGSDKQTYYKLSLAGKEADSVRAMAEDLFQGQCVDGDLALCEAALSAKCFYHLTELGVPFPDNEYGEYVGYKTDHDRGKRASSAGPYTSKIMVECLEREALLRQIPIMDHMQLIKLLVKEEKVYGILCLDTEKTACCEFVMIWCENVVLATGGPAAMYHDSVYPASQLGSSGIAFEAGIRGKNLTEWQFGMASLRPRWNVSGTYMQCLPRIVSTDRQGREEREFLLDYFRNPAEMQSLIFLKGYQWPFDPRKLERGGSSIIDFAVYQETVVKGRRVYLDYTRNPKAAQKDGKFDFTLLSEEAQVYLENSKVMFGTPIERLMKMNRPAYELYKARHIDLEKEWLQISVCAQHNNGGLYADRWWQSNIQNLFPVGEVCGNFGVYRPGGSALNATQVGSLRAAQYISRNGQEPPMEWQIFSRLSQEDMDEVIRDGIRLRENGQGKKKPLELRKQYQREMDESAAFIREEKGISRQIERCRAYIAGFFEETLAETPRELADAWINYDILHTQLVYLTGMLSYIQEDGKSRGSYMISREDFPLKEVKNAGIKLPLDQGERAELIQICSLKQGQVIVENRERKPLPEGRVWFETVYNESLQDAVIGR